MENNKKNLVAWLKQQSGAEIVRTLAGGVIVATPAVQCYGAEVYPCTEISPVLSSIGQAREYFGY